MVVITEKNEIETNSQNVLFCIASSCTFYKFIAARNNKQTKSIYEYNFSVFEFINSIKGPGVYLN